MLRRFLLVAALAAVGPARAQVPTGPPHASVDLGTDEGAQLVQGTWRYADAKVVEVDFRAVGADNKPSGAPNRTYDVVPHAGVADFDDSRWETIAPTTLAARRSTGKVCFNWYRIAVTVPERIGNFDPTGATVAFEITVDDYAEVWVDGKLPRELGQVGQDLVAGWNAPNRVVLGRDVRPGQRFQVVVFGINGPISDAPSNYIWVRNAKLDFYQTPRAFAPRTVPVEVVRLDPALDAIVPRDAKLEKLAEGFRFVEGPIWVGDGLLFSDPNANMIYKWTPDNRVVVWRERSGYQGTDVARYGQPGSNGLTLDAEGRLVVAEHGNRRISRLEKDGTQTILADRFDGKRLNSPNDVVVRSDGAIYFSDPPFGLPQFHADPGKELPHEGVYCLRKGKLALVSRDFTGPNGLAFSPDEKHLYVCNWDEKKKFVMRYDVRPDGALANGKLFFDMTQAPGAEALDGLKVDARGNVYVSGPGGLWILSAAGKHLGTIVGPELAANFAWGDADGRTLYMTARTGLYRMRLGVAGVRPEVALALTAARR